MALKAKKRREEEASLDFTSMIDVVFLLLIFFMVATKFKEVERVLDAFLPKDVGGPPKEDKEEKEEIRIVLYKGETEGVPAKIVVNEIRVKDFDALFHKLVDMHAVDPEIPCILEPKQDVIFDGVIQTLNACSRARLTKVSFSQPPMLIEGVHE